MYFSPPITCDDLLSWLLTRIWLLFTNGYLTSGRALLCGKLVLFGENMRFLEFYSNDALKEESRFGLFYEGLEVWMRLIDVFTVDVYELSYLT